MKYAFIVYWKPGWRTSRYGQCIASIKALTETVNLLIDLNYRAKILYIGKEEQK
jgi:hypothetical protein